MEPITTPHDRLRDDTAVNNMEICSPPPLKRNKVKTLLKGPMFICLYYYSQNDNLKMFRILSSSLTRLLMTLKNSFWQNDNIILGTHGLTSHLKNVLFVWSSLSPLQVQRSPLLYNYYLFAY